MRKTYFGNKVREQRKARAEENHKNALVNLLSSGNWQVTEDEKLQHVASGSVFDALEPALQANAAMKVAAKASALVAEEQYLTDSGWTRLEHNDWSRPAPNGENLVYAPFRRALKMQSRWDT